MIDFNVYALCGGVCILFAFSDENHELMQRGVITFQVTGDFEIVAGKSALGVIGVPDELPADLGFKRAQGWRH